MFRLKEFVGVENWARSQRRGWGFNNIMILAHRSNGRSYATVLWPSVCNVLYCG